MRASGILVLMVLFGCATAAAPTSQEDHSGDVPYWSSGSTTDEGTSTHLFIVDHAMAILGQHQDLTRAARAYAWLSNPTCGSRWRQGLYDADHKVSYNNWYTYESHFYDPSTGTNYLGNTEPVAYDVGLEHLATARAQLAQDDLEHGCYELGLAMHFATDITQPMHAANYAATDYPLDLHSHFEDRASAVENQFIVSDWSAAPTTGVDEVLLDLAWSSNGLWPSTWNALANAFQSRCHNDINSYWFDHTSCWSGDAGVDAAIGVALRNAQVGTAAFLYAADLP